MNRQELLGLVAFVLVGFSMCVVSALAITFDWVASLLTGVGWLGIISFSLGSGYIWRRLHDRDKP